METTEEKILSFGEKLTNMVLYENLLPKIAFGILCVASFIGLLVALYKYKKRKWASLYFVFLSGFCFLWGICLFLSYMTVFSIDIQSIAMMAFLFIPGLVCLHIWKQVSYKEITSVVSLVIFFVPVVLFLILVLNMLHPIHLAAGNSGLRWNDIVFAIYASIVLIKSYLLCFNVFYQMPRHMRKSSIYLLSGITAFSINFVMYFSRAEEILPSIIGQQASSIILPLVPPLSVALMLYMFYNAFYVAPASNVIATSRDFVFSSLSTTILVVSVTGRILDWNKKGKKAIAPLPVPKYREKYEEYRERLLQEGHGKVSPHGENIIMLTHDDVETHYLISTHEIGTKTRQFGSLVEIADVTKIYSVLRYWEEIAMRDQLTSLYNRNAYINMVPKLVAPEHMPLSVIVGDVNNLKNINDTYGHLAGDELLKTISHCIEKSMPEGGFAARIGGDEYVLLLSHGSDELTRSFITKMDIACSEIHNEKYDHPSVAWGYSLMTSVQEEYNDVFAKADRMMYETKKQNFTFHSSGFIPDMNTEKTIPPADAEEDQNDSQ